MNQFSRQKFADIRQNHYLCITLLKNKNYEKSYDDDCLAGYSIRYAGTDMGMSRTIEFTEEGKMVASSEISNLVYDEDGYLKSATMSMMGQSTDVKYKWENGRLKSLTFSMMGQEGSASPNYDEKGVVVSETIDMGGQKIDSPYTDYKFDDRGNWISRKSSMMGQEMVTTRTITYY